MKRIFFVVFILGIIFLGGCAGTSSKKEIVPLPPRRVFESIEIVDNVSTTPFIVRDFIRGNNTFQQGSVNFATALFLADLGILAEITKEQFEIFSSVIFSEFPQKGQVKEIVIPNLSRSSDSDAERNAYLFVTRQQNSEGRYFYLLETNIPISGIYDRPYYDGYVMNLNRGFLKNEIPGSWTAIMFLHYVDNNLFYRGIAYPSKSAPLIITERGELGLDVSMNAVISGLSTVTEVRNKLRETVAEAVRVAEPENQQEFDSIRRLEQFTYLSLSAYSYIDGIFYEAKNYFLRSEEITVEISTSPWGRRQQELRNIMNFLLNTIGK